MQVSPQVIDEARTIKHSAGLFKTKENPLVPVKQSKGVLLCDLLFY
jgi:hypothetical protein